MLEECRSKVNLLESDEEAEIREEKNKEEANQAQDQPVPNEKVSTDRV